MTKEYPIYLLGITLIDHSESSVVETSVTQRQRICFVGLVEQDSISSFHLRQLLVGKECHVIEHELQKQIKIRTQII